MGGGVEESSAHLWCGPQPEDDWRATAEQVAHLQQPQVPPKPQLGSLVRQVLHAVVDAGVRGGADALA